MSFEESLPESSPIKGQVCTSRWVELTTWPDVGSQTSSVKQILYTSLEENPKTHVDCGQWKIQLKPKGNLKQSEMDTSWAMEGHGNDRFWAVSTTRASYLQYGQRSFDSKLCPIYHGGAVASYNEVEEISNHASSEAECERACDQEFITGRVACLSNKHRQILQIIHDFKRKPGCTFPVFPWESFPGLSMLQKTHTRTSSSCELK